MLPAMLDIRDLVASYYAKGTLSPAKGRGDRSLSRIEEPYRQKAVFWDPGRLPDVLPDRGRRQGPVEAAGAKPDQPLGGGIPFGAV